MKLRSNKSGFSIVEVIIVVVVIGIVGFLSYAFYNNQINKAASNDSSQTNSEPTTTSDVQQAPEINSVADLDKAEAILDQTNPNSSNTADTNRLNTELATF